MQTTPNFFRFSGLIAILGLLSLMVGLILILLLPGMQLAAWGILLLGILLLATAFIIDFRRVRSALTSRRGRFSTGTTVMASIFIGIILLFNAISIGHYLRFDVTALAEFTLTSKTKDALSKLETPVEALGFFTPDDPYGIVSYATSLLNEYKNYTDKLSIKIIDPDEHPDQARQYGISDYSKYQSVVFESQNRRRLVSPNEIVSVSGGRIVGIEAEHAFTSAILEVTGTVQKKLYFLTGQDEHSINSDYSAAVGGLRDNLYRVETLDLLRTPTIPQDCAALIIAGPRKALTNGEFDIIKRYLDNGGWVMILINPIPPQDIKQLLSPWGVDIQDGTVIDPSSYATPNKSSPSVPRTNNFFNLPIAYFPESAAIIPQEKIDETVELRPLVWTSRGSWLERNFDPSKEPFFNEEVDLKGPLALGVLITTALPQQPQEQAKFKDTRIVVFGDSDFASNQNYYNGNNGELFLNAVNLLTIGKELITIERKVLPFRTLRAVLEGPEAANFIRYSSIGLLPLLVLAVGGIMWWRRR